MGLSEYIMESVASGRVRKYRPSEPTKESILSFLDRNGFDKIQLDPHNPVSTDSIIMDKKREQVDNLYIMSPYPGRMKSGDWISIHSKRIYELVIWFDDLGDVEEIELRNSLGGPSGRSTSKLSFEDAAEIMANMLK